MGSNYIPFLEQAVVHNVLEKFSLLFFFLWVPHQFCILYFYDSQHEHEDAIGGTCSKNAIKLAILVRRLR